MTNLVACPDCKHDISSTARECPSCGRVLIEQREPIYTALVNIRNTELSVYSTRYNVLAALNTGFFAVVLTTFSKGGLAHPRALLLVSASLGILFAAIWLGVAVHAKRLVADAWDQWIAEYETKYFRASFSLFSDFNKRDAHSPIHPRKEKSSWVSRIEAHLPRWCWWSNLNFPERLLPTLFILAWLSMASVFYA